MKKTNKYFSVKILLVLSTVILISLLVLSINRLVNTKTSSFNTRTKAQEQIMPTPVKTTSSFSCKDVKEIPESECDALVDFYRSLNGDKWHEKLRNNWLKTNTPCEINIKTDQDESLSDPNIIHAEGWKGVHCRDNYVNQLLLDSSILYNSNNRRSNIQGKIPESIGSLKYLKHFIINDSIYPESSIEGKLPLNIRELHDLEMLIIMGTKIGGPLPDVFTGENFPNLRSLSLSSNKFTGQIPKQLFTSMPQLIELNLNSNQFEDNLVQRLSGLPEGFISPKLQTIKLRNNALSGAIPEAFQYFRELKHLDLSNNKFNGSLLGEIFKNLKNLETLNLSGNNFSGSIPLEIGWLGELKLLNLSFNYLEEAIPESFFSLKKLEYLNLSNNGLSESITSDLGNLPEMRILDLSKNKLSGSIPETLGRLSKLSRLNLRVNNLEDVIPNSIGHLMSIEHLDLSYNALTGPIPETFSRLYTLQTMDLSHNKLSEIIPSGLGKLTNLTKLFLGYNNFTGPIPESFGDLKNLSYLQLAHNQLTGRIPDSLSTVSLKNPSAYAIYDLSYNLLSGPIPSELEKIRYATFYLEGNNDLCMPDDEYFQQWLKKHVAFKLADTLRICPTPKGRTTPKGRIYQAE